MRDLTASRAIVCPERSSRMKSGQDESLIATSPVCPATPGPSGRRYRSRNGARACYPRPRTGCDRRRLASPWQFLHRKARVRRGGCRCTIRQGTCRSPTRPSFSIIRPNRAMSRKDALDAAAGQTVARPVDAYAGIFGSAHGSPYAFGDDVVKPLPRNPHHGMGDNVGFDRTVVKARAMFGVPDRQAQDLIPDATGPAGHIDALRRRLPARTIVHDADIAVGNLIVLGETRSRCHVEHMLQCRAVPGSFRQLRKIGRDRRRRVKKAVADKAAHGGGGHRLRHRLQQVDAAWPHAVVVAFMKDFAVLPDEHRIGKCRVEHRTEGRLLPVAIREGETVQ